MHALCVDICFDYGLPYLLKWNMNHFDEVECQIFELSSVNKTDTLCNQPFLFHLGISHGRYEEQKIVMF